MSDPTVQNTLYGIFTCGSLAPDFFIILFLMTVKAGVRDASFIKMQTSAGS